MCKDKSKKNELPNGQHMKREAKPLILPASVEAKSFQAVQARCTFIMFFLRRIKVKAATFSVMLRKHN